MPLIFETIRNYLVNKNKNRAVNPKLESTIVHGPMERLMFTEATPEPEPRRYPGVLGSALSC